MKQFFFITLMISSSILLLMINAQIYENMKCKYGERGSLTAECINATSGYFRSTNYKFDYLDETLICINCSLTTIESNTFDLSGNQIKNLHLKSAKIEYLKPKAFMGLIFLLNLDLSDNKIRSIYPGTFAGTKKITTLNLNKNYINILSENGFAELTNLRELNLAENLISTIDPKAFNGLNNNLIELNMHKNLISDLKNSFDNLTSLQFLYLQNNNLKTFSGLEFQNLGALLHLDLSANNITDNFNISLKSNNTLRVLLLHHNQFTKLWFNFMNLDFLEYLDLSANNIEKIETFRWTFLLRNLKEIRLANNRFKIFDTRSFSGFPQLEYLNFTQNFIEEIALEGIYSLNHLNTLDLSHNNITDFDYTALISRLPTLTYLRLEGNYLACNLEQEMETEFSEDNFKFVLYELENKKCIENALVKKSKNLIYDKFLKINESNDTDSMSGLNITIFILISVIFFIISILFYLQYLSHRGQSFELKLPKFSRRNDVPNVRLIPNNEGDDLYEGENVQI